MRCWGIKAALGGWEGKKRFKWMKTHSRRLHVGLGSGEQSPEGKQRPFPFLVGLIGGVGVFMGGWGIFPML